MTTLKLLVLLLFHSTQILQSSFSPDMLVVKTTGGFVRGVQIQPKDLTLPWYIAFKGIPYAEPPVGTLRFRNPIPHRGWSGVRDASNHGNICPSNGILGLFMGGDEDCLFLNVYTTNVFGNLPVFVYIHGGGYLFGSGDSSLYGPSRLMKEDIVVVTINYRLGALGFLSTGDKYAQGNYALKDMILALKWVNRNIRNFGGNCRQITIAGESAGSVSVHHLTMSYKTRGLFKRAIMMSGGAFAPYSFQTKPLEKAETLARALNINFDSSKTLIRKLKEVHFKDIMRVERDFITQDFPLLYRPYDFGIVVEPEDSLEERFLTDSPVNILRSGNFRTVPVMVGTATMEGIFVIACNRRLDYYDIFNEQLEHFVPSFLNISSDDIDGINKVGTAIKEAYFGSKKVSDSTLKELSKFVSDGVFKFDVDRSVKFMAKKSRHPIYYYEFDYVGTLNFIRIVSGITFIPGATHADDLIYLFEPEDNLISIPKSMIPQSNHAFVVRDRMVRLWTNFVKYGNPTPNTDDLLGILKWPSYTLENEEFMRIGYNLSIKNHFKRFKIWYQLVEKYIGRD